MNQENNLPLPIYESEPTEVALFEQALKTLKVAKPRMIELGCAEAEYSHIFWKATGGTNVCLDILPRQIEVAKKYCGLEENETLNDIANFLGKGEQVKEITDLGLKGRLDFSTSLENRVHLLKGLRLSSLEEAKRIVTFMKGAKKLFRVLKENNITTVLVSGGFKPITTYVKNYLKIDYEYSNSFGVIGDLFDGTTTGPIINANYKEKIVNKLIKELDIKKNQIIGMGDAANDMNMLFSVGLPIAFKAQEIVKANFDNQINNTDLTTVLYFLGIKN